MIHQSKHVVRDRDDVEIAFDTFCPELLYAASINPNTGQSEIKRITAYQRHLSPAYLYEVETRCGRKVQVTGDHNFWVLRKGQLVLTRTEALTKNDCIPLPRCLESLAPQKDLKTIDLLRYLEREDLFVEAQQDLKEMVLAVGENAARRNLHGALLRPRAEKFSAVNSGRERLSAAAYSRFMGGRNGHGVLGSLHSPTSFLLDLPVTSDFLKLLGLFIAEGCTTSRSVCLSVREEELVRQISGILDRMKFSYGRRKTDGDFYVNDKTFAVFFRTIAGHGAFKKQLPDFWTELSLEQLGLLLNMYFTGDGWVDKNDVKCTTASEKLASQLLYALNRFGIWGRLKKRWQRATNSTNPGNWYYQITISGQSSLKCFSENIGFSLGRKTCKLERLLKRVSCENTNVDLAPGAGVFLKRLREKYSLFQRQMACYAGLGRAAIGMIEQGKRQISQQALRRFLEQWPHGESEDILSLKLLTKSYWTPVEFSKKYLSKEKYVYDFSVEDNETFLAGFGGMYVHNTMTIAKVIAEVQRPTIVIAHNKTLAAQLCSEFREFFPNNSVHYFVSYYDYYQPEAYNPHTDTYIEKDAAINEEIDKFRHAATMHLLTRRDVIIVASVSCIYGLGSPSEYLDLSIEIKAGDSIPRDRLLRRLTDLLYTRAAMDFKPGMFHVLGDTVEILPPGQDFAYRLEFFGDEIERISEVDAFTGELQHEMESIRLFPAKHAITTKERIEKSVQQIRADLEVRVEELQKSGRMIEAQRLRTKTEYDLEILIETGYCPGVENYTRYLNDLKPGQPSATLLDYFPDDFLMVIDESHMTVPQIGAMYNGNFSRKQTLVEYGFRLPSAHDNRPLKFEEFENYMKQVIFVSATPSKYEYEHTPKESIAEQVIRPTGLLDPEIEVRPTEGQVPDLLEEIKKRTVQKERTLVTTLTKRASETLTDFLTEKGIAVRYLHSDVDTLERVEILRDFRLGKFDVLVGINLLREGLDLPEVSLIGILDADKQGFLRSATALIQTIGRAARNVNGRVIMYGDKITDAMKQAIDETDRRRTIQREYNTKHGITPETIVKAVKDLMLHRQDAAKKQVRHYDKRKIPKSEISRLVESLEAEMDLASQNMEFEKAAELRDEIESLREGL
ncbi:MAG: excinuclease ABC subunit UvrB [Candidatus Gracilibacteria bacterium]